MQKRPKLVTVFRASSDYSSVTLSSNQIGHLEGLLLAVQVEMQMVW